MSNPFALDAPAPATAPATATATAPAQQSNPFGAGGPVPPAAPVTVQAGAQVQHAAPAASASPDPFDAPAPQEPRGPRLQEMYGRLVIIIPRKLENGVVSRSFRNPDGSPVIQDRMTADVVVLDGGTIHYGGKPEKLPPIPHTKTAEVPLKVNGMYISSVGLISQCRQALAKIVSEGRPGMVLGRLAKGEDSGKGEPPWLLTPATDADKATGKAYLATVDPFA